MLYIYKYTTYFYITDAYTLLFDHYSLHLSIFSFIMLIELLKGLIVYLSFEVEIQGQNGQASRV